jgi:hypothetical protein
LGGRSAADDACCVAAQVRVDDTPLWVRKAVAYQEWLVQQGREDIVPSRRDAALLQAVYDEDDDHESFFL